MHARHTALPVRTRRNSFPNLQVSHGYTLHLASRRTHRAHGSTMAHPVLGSPTSWPAVSRRSSWPVTAPTCASSMPQPAPGCGPTRQAGACATSSQRIWWTPTTCRSMSPAPSGRCLPTEIPCAQRSYVTATSTALKSSDPLLCTNKSGPGSCGTFRASHTLAFRTHEHPGAGRFGGR